MNEVGQLCRAEVHQGGPGQTQHEEQPDGGAEDLALLVLPALGVSLLVSLEMARGKPAVEMVSSTL